MMDFFKSIQEKEEDTVKFAIVSIHTKKLRETDDQPQSKYHKNSPRISATNDYIRKDNRSSYTPNDRYNNYNDKSSHRYNNYNNRTESPRDEYRNNRHDSEDYRSNRHDQQDVRSKRPYNNYQNRNNDRFGRQGTQNQRYDDQDAYYNRSPSPRHY